MSSVPTFPNIQNVPSIDSISNETVNKLSEDILIALTPYLYVIIGVISVICLLLIYISIMTTLTFKRAGKRQR